MPKCPNNFHFWQATDWSLLERPTGPIISKKKKIAPKMPIQKNAPKISTFGKPQTGETNRPNQKEEENCPQNA